MAIQHCRVTDCITGILHSHAERNIKIQHQQRKYVKYETTFILVKWGIRATKWSAAGHISLCRTTDCKTPIQTASASWHISCLTGTFRDNLTISHFTNDTVSIVLTARWRNGRNSTSRTERLTVVLWIGISWIIHHVTYKNDKRKKSSAFSCVPLSDKCPKM